MNYCLGTVQFGINYGIQNNGKPNLDSVYSILDTAISSGISYFDTAMAYGDAENILGQYILSRTLKQDSIRIITKDKSQSNFKVLSDNINKSIDRMCINKLYGFLFHDSAVVNNKELMAMLYEIRKNDYADKIGVSIYTPDEALKALEYDIDIIQVPYNIFDNRLDKVGFFEKAKEKKIEIYARSSLLQGLALMDYNKLPENVEFAKDYLIKFDDLCRKYKIDRLNAAVNYVSSNKYIDFIVFGTDNINQLKEYLSIRENVLQKSFIEDIKRSFKNVPDKLVNPTLWK